MRDIEYTSPALDYTVHTDHLQRCVDIAAELHDKPLFEHIDNLHIALASARCYERLIAARVRTLKEEVPA